MRTALVLAPFSMLGAVWFLFRGFLLTAQPCEFATSLPSAREYWVEYTDANYKAIRRGWRGCWSIDAEIQQIDTAYDGGRCTLRKVYPPGLERHYLVFECEFDAHSIRVIVWECLADGSLSRAADFISYVNLPAGADAGSLETLFRDIDGDGVEELVESRTVLVHSSDDVHYATFYRYHVWTGKRFVPLYRQTKEDGPPELIDESVEDD